MKISEDQIKLLKSLANNNIEFWGSYSSYGSFTVEVDDLEDFINNPDELMARKNGVSVKQFLAWLDFTNSCWICMGKTKAGNKCSNKAGDGFKIDNPSKYSLSNPSVYCHQHTSQAY